MAPSAMIFHAVACFGLQNIVNDACRGKWMPCFSGCSDRIRACSRLMLASFKWGSNMAKIGEAGAGPCGVRRICRTAQKPVS